VSTSGYLSDTSSLVFDENAALGSLLSSKFDYSSLKHFGSDSEGSLANGDLYDSLTDSYC
jgi:hypothetical protein